MLFLHEYTFVVMEPQRDGQVTIFVHTPGGPEHPKHLSASAEKLDK